MSQPWHDKTFKKYQSQLITHKDNCLIDDVLVNSQLALIAEIDKLVKLKEELKYDGKGKQKKGGAGGDDAASEKSNNSFDVIDSYEF